MAVLAVIGGRAASQPLPLDVLDTADVDYSSYEVLPSGFSVITEATSLGVGGGVDHFDEAYGITIDGVPYGASAGVVNGSTLTLDPVNIGQYVIENQLFSTGPFMRQIVTITNTGPAAVAALGWHNNTGNDTNQTVISDNTGDGVFDADDRWAVTSDNALGTEDNEVNAWAVAGPGPVSIRPDAVLEVDGRPDFGFAGEQGVSATYSVPLAAGESRSVMMLTAVEGLNADAVNIATSQFDLPDSVFLDQIAGDLSPGERAAVSNWDLPLPDNDFLFSPIVLEPGTQRLTDALRNDPAKTGPNPDTLLGAFEASGELIELDDDDSPTGNGLASGLFGIPVNPDGSIELQVTGFPDFDFTGDHDEAGPYNLVVDIFDAGGTPIDQFVFSESLDTFSDLIGNVDAFSLNDPSYVGGTFDAQTDNDLGQPAGDVDFFQFTGLAPDAQYVAEINTIDDVDTVLGVFDPSTGDAVLDVDDDDGDGVRSRLVVTTDFNGELIVAVSGFFDFTFDGNHSNEGAYELMVTLAGDYNGDGFVSQADLDLVLLNWGDSVLPLGFDQGAIPTGNFEGGFDGLMSQNELDGVLLNWGNGTPTGVNAIPEPGVTSVVCFIGGLLTCRRRRRLAP